MVAFPRKPRHPHMIRPGSGYSDELYWLRQQIADTFAALSPGGGGGGWNYVLNSLPGAVPDPGQNVYTTFASLMAVLDALPTGVTPTVQYIGNVTITTAGMPPTGWRFPLGIWRSPILATGSVTVTLDPGVIIDSLSEIVDGLAVIANPTVDGETFQWNYIDALVGGGGAVWVLAIGRGAAVRNASASALILGPGTNKFIVIATQAPSFSALPPSVGPFVKADAPDVVIDAQSFSGFYGSLPDGWLVGSANRIRQVGVDTRTADLPGATGTILFDAQSILNPQAQTTARKTLIYTNLPFTPAESDTFDDFEKFYALYSTLNGPIDIEFHQDPTGPSLEIPAKAGGGFFQMKSGTRWISVVGMGQPCQVSLEPGAEVRDLTWVGDNVAIIGNGGTLTWTDPVPGGQPTVLVLNGLGCALASQSGGPLINVGFDISIAGPMIIALTKTASITKGGGGGPIIDITPTGAWTAGVIIYNIEGTLDDSTISGSDGPGTALFGSIVGPGAQQSLRQPGWAAAASLGALYQAQQRPRFNIQTPPLTVVGPYIMGDVVGIFPYTTGDNGSEFVRVSPTANAVGVQLPDPVSCVGQTVCIKEVSGAPAFTTDLTTPSGNIEGAAGPYSLAAIPYFSTRLTSDGTDWWIT